MLQQAVQRVYDHTTASSAVSYLIAVMIEGFVYGLLHFEQPSLWTSNKLLSASMMSKICSSS